MNDETPATHLTERVSLIEDVLTAHRYVDQGFYDADTGWSFNIWCAGCDWNQQEPDRKGLNLELVHRKHLAEVIEQAIRDASGGGND